MGDGIVEALDSVEPGETGTVSGIVGKGLLPIIKKIWQMNGRELTQLFQGLELVVAAQLEKRGPATHHWAFTQGSKLLNSELEKSNLFLVAQSRQGTRLLSSRPNWKAPPPPGWGSQFGREDRHCGSLGISVLCAWFSM